MTRDALIVAAARVLAKHGVAGLDHEPAIAQQTIAMLLAAAEMAWLRRLRIPKERFGVKVVAIR